MLRPGVSRAAGDPLTQKSAEAPTFQDLLEVGYSESFLDVGPMGPLGVERPGSPILIHFDCLIEHFSILSI